MIKTKPTGVIVERTRGTRLAEQLGRSVMKSVIAAVTTAGAFALSTLLLAPTARAADVLTLSSPAIQDNGTLATKNACSDKQRTPNCVGENISPPLAWSNVPDGTKSFALVLVDPEGRAPAGVSHMVVYGIPAGVQGFVEGELSKPSDKFVGGKSTMNQGVYFGAGPPPNVDW